jgi:hypothetical protein
MGMHYELWDTDSANVIDVYRTEAEGLAMVRALLKAGWDAEHLSLGLDFDEGTMGVDDALPPVLHGAELEARAYAEGCEAVGGKVVIGGKVVTGGTRTRRIGEETTGARRGVVE